LARLDVGIMGSNPTRGMDVYVYVYVYYMFVLSCVGRGLAMSWSLIQGVLPYVYKRLRNQIAGHAPVRAVKLLKEKSSQVENLWPLFSKLLKNQSCTRGLKHEQSSSTRILRSWVRITFETWMSPCPYCVCVDLYADSGIVTGWSPVEGVPATV
jgi:hypothetical protein